MSILEPNPNLPRVIAHALEDSRSEPLRELMERAPDPGLRFSELEIRVSDWSFAYGVAWALARVRDPFLSSEKVADVAQTAVRDAWRAHTGYEFWAAALADSRHPGSLYSAAAAAAGEPGAQLDAFMQRLARMRLREPAAERVPAQTDPAPGNGA